MKKTLTVIALLAGAVSGYSQGVISFSFYNGTGLKQQVFNSQPIASSTYLVTYGGVVTAEEVGSTAANIETPKGTTVYTGTGLSGTGYDIALLAGPAGITTDGGTSSANGAANVGLTQVSGVANFHTAVATAGMQAAALSVTLPNTSYFAVGDQVSLAVAAWNNEGGTITSLAQAIAADAQNPGLVPFGISPVVTTTYSGGISSSPPSLMPTTLESFSLGTTVPEPSTIALGVMGASALLFRRKK
jgi:hypothetical protein